MAVSVNMPHKREEKDPFDTILKGLSVASQIYGVKLESDRNDIMAKNSEVENKLKADELKLKQDLQPSQLAHAKAQASKAEMESQKLGLDIDNEKKGIVSKSDFFKDAYKYDVSDKPGRGNFGLGLSSGETMYLKPRPPVVDPLVNALRSQQLIEKQNEAKYGKAISANDASAFGDYNAAFKALERAKQAYDSNQDLTGPVQGRLNKGLGFFEIGDTGKRFKAFDAQQKINAQVIGKALEGGKLTDADIDRYKDMLPNEKDSPEAAKEKATILQNMIAERQQEQITALKRGGFNTKNLEASPMQSDPNLRTLVSQEETKDAAAMKAQEILKKMEAKKNGLKSIIRK